MKPKNKAAQALARLSRVKPTKAQIEASKRNGEKGGRPKGSKNKKKNPPA